MGQPSLPPRDASGHTGNAECGCLLAAYSSEVERPRRREVDGSSPSGGTLGRESVETYDEGIWLEMGRADAGQPAPTSDSPPAVLWVPDPEQRHGWREYYVKRPEAAKRPIGFQTKRGARC